MSTLRLTTISNQTGSSSVPSETVINGSAKAWVNFNGTGTIAIRASFNVSSITDNGAGDYTPNFTVAMPDANFAYSVTAGNGSNDIFSMAPYVTAPTASTLRVLTALGSRVATDCSHVAVAIFR